MPNSQIEKYRQLCDQYPIPLFMQAWWMDAVCCEHKEWNVLLVERKGKIVGALPYHLIKKMGFKVILQPQHTQYNGVWIDYPENVKEYQRYAFEKDVITDLIDQLNKLGVDYYEQNFHYSLTNWHPFYWKGFKQTTHYTYVIENIADKNAVYESFCPRSKHKHIKKTESGYIVDFSLSAEEFYAFHKLCLYKIGKEISYSLSLFLSMHQSSVSRNQGQIFSIKDISGNLHAVLFVVWDDNSAYNLIVAIDPLYKSSGASTRIVWEAICYLSDKTKVYDFEGSMIEGVAYNNELFGAIQKPYFNISKSNSRLFTLLMNLRTRYGNHK